MNGPADPLPPWNLIDSDQVRARLSRLLPNVAPSSVKGADSEIEERLAQARAAFLHGYHETLSAPADALPRLLEKEPPNRRGFALEGAGMASAMVDYFVNGSGCMLEAVVDGRSPAETTLVAVGAGWANARLHQPPARLPRGIRRRHLGAIVDGYGFHHGFFHPARFEGRGFPKRDGMMDTNYDVGLGRALWFIHAGRPDWISRAVNKIAPDRRASLWRGVGTACAFTGCTFAGTDFASRAISASAASRDHRVGSAAHSEVWMMATTATCHFQEGLKAGTQLLRALGPHKVETLS